MNLGCKLLERDLLVQKGRFEALDARAYFLQTGRGSLLLVRDGLFALGFFWRDVLCRLFRADLSDLRLIARELSRYVGRSRGSLDLFDSEYSECPYRRMNHGVTVVFQKTHMNLAWFRGQVPLSTYHLSLLPGDIVFFSSRLHRAYFKQGLKLSSRMRLGYLRAEYKRQSKDMPRKNGRVVGQIDWG